MVMTDLYEAVCHEFPDDPPDPDPVMVQRQLHLNREKELVRGYLGRTELQDYFTTFMVRAPPLPLRLCLDACGTLNGCDGWCLAGRRDRRRWQRDEAAAADGRVRHWQVVGPCSLRHPDAEAGAARRCRGKQPQRVSARSRPASVLTIAALLVCAATLCWVQRGFGVHRPRAVPRLPRAVAPAVAASAPDEPKPGFRNSQGAPRSRRCAHSATSRMG